ncbi:MAG: phosphomethylpyrimidine synthase ThiC [Methanofollis sp.]|nr:phosphomethylpyrimidine synthase ThiC [Methanofollis sp.]
MCVMQTLIKECLKGVPPEVEAIARDEGLSPRQAARAVTRGRITVAANPRRPHRLCAVGEGCSVKVNVNIGTSAERCDPDLEIEKGKVALANGADTLMDLSTGGDLPAIRKRILELDTPLGTVPIYEAVRRAGSAADVTADLLFKVIREHCQQGVDFLTLHCGVNQDAFADLKADPRIMGVVSRGGAFHVAMMAATGEENPLYKEYDYLLEILEENDVVISLGDGMRPGCIYDAERLAKATEYITLGRLSRRALSAGVQRFIEGPGHMPIDEIGYNVKMIKEVCDGAPLYLLGPLVTDIAPGYDHVVGAIGGAVAAMHGADFLCMVSPSEHLALPDIDDIAEGTRVARVSAHVGDIVRLGEGASSAADLKMAQARQRLNWEEQFEAAMFSDLARTVHARDGDLDTCSMCGDLCAIKMVREALKGEDEKKN